VSTNRSLIENASVLQSTDRLYLTEQKHVWKNHIQELKIISHKMAVLLGDACYANERTPH